MRNLRAHNYYSFARVYIAVRISKLFRNGGQTEAVLKACANGSSELLSNVSASVVSMLYNMQLMKYAGEDGVAAYGVLMYVNMIFLAAFIGLSGE